MEPVDAFQMQSCTVLESKLQVAVRKILASSSVYYLILMWLIRVVVFVLWIGKGFLIWVLTFSFSLIRECTQKYLSVALVSLALTPQEQQRAPEELIPDVDTTREEDTKRTGEEKEFERRLEGGAAEVEVEVEAEAEATTSPLLPIVLRDRLQICEENRALKDRERLSYEFEKIVAPQVSAFQLGEIIVPIDDTRQLATFLKLKLTETCKSQSSEDINAAICGSILNIRAEGAISHSVESWERNGNIKYAVVYIAARLQGERHIHLVLVGRKVEHFLGSSEFRTRFNPPRTRGDKKEWHKWTLAHLRSLHESAIDTAEALLAMEPVHARMW